MPLYQIATDEGTLEIDHSGPPEDLNTAVSDWVSERRAARAAEEQGRGSGFIQSAAAQTAKTALDIYAGLESATGRLAGAAMTLPAQIEAAAAKSSQEEGSKAMAAIDENLKAVGGVQMGDAATREKAASMFEAYGANPEASNIAAQLGRGVGTAINLIPAMAGGELPLIAGALGGASDAYTNAFSETEKRLRKEGVSEAEIKDAAEKEASKAAIETAPALAAYMIGGKISAGIVAKLLPKTLSTTARAAVSGTAAAATNVGVSSALRQQAPTPESATVDVLLGGLSGLEAIHSRPAAKAVDQAISEVATSTPPAPPSVETKAGVAAPDVTTETPVPRAGEPETGASVKSNLSAAELNDRIDVLLTKHQAETDPAIQSQIFAEAKGLMEQLKVAEGQSMGPGAASAEEALGKRIVSMKNEAIDQARQERGQEPLTSEAKRTFGESWDTAMEVISRDEKAPENLVNEINSGSKTSISEVEQQMLLHEEIKLRNERDMEIDRAAAEDTPEPERAASLERASALEEKINQTEQANRKAGTSSGRALSIRRQMMYDDFTPAAIERRVRAAKGGEPLTSEEIASIQKDSEAIRMELEKEKERVATLEKEAATRAAEDALKQEVGETSVDRRVLDYAERVVKRWENDAIAARKRLRSKLGMTSAGVDPTILSDVILIARAYIGRGGLNAAEFSASAVKEFGQAIEPYIDKAWEAANEQLNKLGKELPPRKRKAVIKTVKGQAGTEAERQAIIAGVAESAKDGAIPEQAVARYVKLLFRNFVESGMRGLDNITTAVHSIIEPHVPGITKDQIRDAFSNYGKYKEATTVPSKVYLSQLTGEAQKVSQLQDIIELRQNPKPTGQQRVPPSDITRRLTKLVNEARKKYNIQPADPAKALKTALDSRKTYYRNKLSDLRFEIARREQTVKEKTAPPTDPELESLKAEYAQVRADHDAIFGKKEMTDQQRLEVAIKAAERAEANARQTLEDARRGVFPGPKPPGPTSPQLEAIRARSEALRQEAKELRQMSDSFKAEAEQKKIAETERQIAELDRKLREGDLSTKPKGPEATGRLAALQAERAALVKELARQRREAIPKRSPDEIALQSYAARLAREEADLLERNAKADTGDATAFEKRKPAKLDISKDPEVMRRKAVVEQLKQKLRKKEHEYILSRRTTTKRIIDGIAQTFNAGKNIVSAFDFSAPRQAAFAIAASPTKGIKALLPMFKGWASEIRAREQDQRIHNRPNALNGLDKQAKIEYTPLDETTFTKAEENARSVLDDWAELPFRTGNATKSAATAPFKAVAKGVRMSNRAFITFLNTIRADLFDSLLHANFKDRAPTTAELEALGNYVNVSTGRGKLNPKTASVAAGFLWAPKLLTSRIQLLAGQPFYRGSLRTRGIIAKQYAKVLVSGYLLYKVSQLFSDKHEDDPRSSDFGKIKIGNIRIDPWGGLQQISVLASRLATGKTKSAKTNEIKDIRGEKRKFGAPSVTDVLSTFIRTKLSPPVGSAVDLLSGENVVGQKVSPVDVALNLTVPLSFRDIFKVMKQEGLPTAIIIQILSTFGAGVSVYDDQEKVNRQ